jgi:hypothetical protein
MARGTAPAAAVTAACAAAVCVWLLAFQAGNGGGFPAAHTSSVPAVAGDRRTGDSGGLLRRGDAAAAAVTIAPSPPPPPPSASDLPSPPPSATASPPTTASATASPPATASATASAPPPPPATPSQSPPPPPATPTGTPPATPSPSPRSAAAAAAVLAACMRRLGAPGGLPGSFAADGRWAPTDAGCAEAWWDAHRPAAVSSAVSNATLFFLGDSVLRDLMVSMGALLATGPPGAAVDDPPPGGSGGGSVGPAAPPSAWGAARLRAKTGCQKTNNADRDGACGASYGGGAVGRFMWHQWLAAPHRIPWGSSPGRGTGYQQQEKDGCCAWAHGVDGTNASAAWPPGVPSVSPRAPGADDPSTTACLRAFFRGATPRDVLVLRTGMNYPLYDPGLGYETEALPDWRAALAEDAHRFLTTSLPAAFPGTVVWWLLDPVLDVGEGGGRCREGKLAGLSRLVPQARALQHAAVARAAAADPSGLAATRLWTVDPTNLFPPPPGPDSSSAAAGGRARWFIDCVHHNFDMDQLKATAILNVVVAAAAAAAAGRTPPSSSM